MGGWFVAIILKVLVINFHAIVDWFRNIADRIAIDMIKLYITGMEEVSIYLTGLGGRKGGVEMRGRDWESNCVGYKLHTYIHT